MRVRLRYTKTDKLRFVSAIDLGRLWERALRRAGLPIAYSEGFSPHPRVSFPDALPLGYASTGEYAELTFAAAIDLPSGVVALNQAFPDGLQVLDAVVAPDGAAKLARALLASCWDLRYSAPREAVEAAVDAALTAATLPVDRERKGEVTEVDVRPAIHRISSAEQVVRVTLHHVQPPMRPSEVHNALAGPGRLLPDPRLVLRIAQGAPVDGGLVEALSGQLVPPLSSRPDQDFSTTAATCRSSSEVAQRGQYSEYGPPSYPKA